MNLQGDDHAGTYQYLAGLEAGIEREAPSGIGQGSIGYGAGGPVWLDDFRSKRPPSPSELVNSYKSVAYACISLNANAVAKVPLRLYCRTSRGQQKTRFWPTRGVEGAEKSALLKRLHKNPVTRGLAHDSDDIEEVCQHPILDVLATPNPFMDGNTLIQHLCRQLDVLGTVYWYPERTDTDWCPTEIWPLHSQYVTPTKGYGRTIIQDYRYFADTFQFEELVRFLFVSVRDPYLSGYAPLHACFEQVGLIGYYTAVVEGMLRTGARPEGMIGPKDPTKPWSKTERKRVELDVNSRFGRGNQGKIWTVDGSFDFKQFSYTPTDLGGLAISKDARLLAANCFDVPITMLEAESSNKATSKEGSSQHERNAVAPRCQTIGAVLTHQVAQKVDRRLFVAFDEPVQADRKQDADIHAIYLDRQVVAPNEVRSELGKDPREGGDEVNKPRPQPGQDQDPDGNKKPPGKQKPDAPAEEEDDD